MIETWKTSFSEGVLQARDSFFGLRYALRWGERYSRGSTDPPITDATPTANGLNPFVQRVHKWYEPDIGGGLKIELVDERGQTNRVSFQYDGGIEDFVRYLNENKDELHRKVIFFESEAEEGQVEVAMQWNTSYQESIFSFANNINTHEGGTHLSGFRSALTRTLNAYARNKGLLKEKDDNLAGEDVREGLTAVISVKLHDPQFEGQTKTKLGQPADRGPGQGGCQPQAGRVLRGEPGRGEEGDHQGRGSLTGPRGGAQGPRPDSPQVGAGELDPAGQARRLHGQGPEPGRDLRGRGGLRRRLGQAGPRPLDPGGAAAAGEDHQRREEPASTRSSRTTRSRP